MAPRETRIETSRPPLLSKASVERMMSKEPTSTPVVRRGSHHPSPSPAVQAAMSVESPAEMTGMTPGEQAEIMKEAARQGTPFCEQCESA